MAVDVGLAGVVGGDGHVGCPDIPPPFGMRLPSVRVTAGPLRLGLDTEIVQAAKPKNVNGSWKAVSLS